ncbi:hypothetical protein BURCENBC7_AP2587 [Burkholderia cenocepacia BC7]|nr:hypothetical protein BURCENBC7_AP2587 [Burkholderia cenocepacia BC7]
MRDADSATGYTTRITKSQNPDRLSFLPKQFYPNRLYPNLLVAQIGAPPIDQINTVPRGADRA